MKPQAPPTLAGVSPRSGNLSPHIPNPQSPSHVLEHPLDIKRIPPRLSRDQQTPSRDFLCFPKQTKVGRCGRRCEDALEGKGCAGGVARKGLSGL